MNQAEPQSLASRSLGEIAAGLPGATAVFRRHKLDFCCGGSASLELAARKKGIDLTPIEVELAALSPEPNTVPESVDGLIQHILDRYHQVHRREMPELRELALRV
jgi:regulator of cell morphogenesis and NO signaling